jgi:hypothetical protein
MLFDTGAGITSVTPEFAARIGCTPSGAVTGFRMHGERVEFQRCAQVELTVGRHRSNSEIGVFDLGAVLPEELPRLDGIIGLDAFRGRTISILSDLSGLRVESRGSAARATRGLTTARVRLANEAGGAGVSVFVPARTPSVDAWLLLDSGNLRGVLLHPWVFEALGGSGASHEIMLEVEGVRGIQVAPETSRELIYDGAVGASFMRDYSLTIDLQRSLAWWRPTGQ